MAGSPETASPVLIKERKSGIEYLGRAYIDEVASKEEQQSSEQPTAGPAG